MKSKIELGLNIAIAIAIVAIAGVVVKRTFFAEQVKTVNIEAQAQQLLGTRINVPGADWAQNKKSLVFFLKKDCVYCDAVAPTYRQLISEAEKTDVKLIAILPNPVEVGRDYVQALNLPIANVQIGTLSTYKIPGTPTVMMVDAEGVVRGIWIGAAPGQEKEMLAKLVALL